MSKDFELNGPFDVELKILVTDGEQVAQATYSMPSGMFPTVDGIKAAMGEVESQVKKTIGHGFRLCTKREFFDNLIRERTGSPERFAMPGSDEWDTP